MDNYKILFCPLSNCIWIRMHGGLGNQMFQYSFARTLADLRGAELFLDTSCFRSNIPGVTPREFALNVFAIRGRINQQRIVYSDLALKVLHHVPFVANQLKVCFENTSQYDEKVLCNCNCYYYVGYWQSPKYFSHNAKIIFEDFNLATSVSSYASQFVNSLDYNNSVMLHVRRGDYITSTTASKYHYTLGKSYYSSAVSEQLKVNPFFHFYVFSDDISWCKNNKIITNAPVTYVDYQYARPDWEELWIMSHFKYQIIANSSFSWWAAWLADQRYDICDRLVIAPLKWFVQKIIIPGDRFPYHWRLL